MLFMCLFVLRVLVCVFLPSVFGVGDWLRLVIVTLPGLFFLLFSSPEPKAQGELL